MVVAELISEWLGVGLFLIFIILLILLIINGILKFNELTKNLQKTKEFRIGRNALYSGLIAVISFSSFAIFVLPFLLTRTSIFKSLSYAETGQVGDTINGIAGPFISVLIAILTFLAFYIQYQANNIQKNELKKQESIRRNEQFDAKFYELLKLHKENVNEISLSEFINGRDCFTHLFKELKFIYKVVEKKYLELPEDKIGKYKENGFENEKLKLAYSIFYWGIMHKRNYVYEEFKISRPFYHRIVKNLQSHQKSCTKLLHDNSTPYIIDSIKLKEKYKILEVQWEHYPFGGYSGKIGHYYRHLFQTCKFVLSSNYNFSKKYSYLKIIRAQLSDYEQLMLYYNAKAWFSDEWQVLFTKYSFIKNLPIELMDFDERPLKYIERQYKLTTQESRKIFEYYGH